MLLRNLKDNFYFTKAFIISLLLLLNTSFDNMQTPACISFTMIDRLYFRNEHAQLK